MGLAQDIILVRSCSEQGGVGILLIVRFATRARQDSISVVLS